MHIHNDQVQNDLIYNDRDNWMGPDQESQGPGDMAPRLSYSLALLQN